MIETVTRTKFINWFRQSDTYKNNFSFFAQASLYDYFEEYEEDPDAFFEKLEAVKDMSDILTDESKDINLDNVEKIQEG